MEYLTTRLPPISSSDEIIIVGNGPSLLEHRLGSSIDAFPQVVRFNGYEIAGFEEHVGTRTTIWSRWYALPTTRPVADLDRIWLNMPIHERTTEKIAKALTLVGQATQKVEIIPAREVATELQQSLFDSSHGSKWPSSGILAIAHAVSIGCKVVIAGFDSWSKEPFHYYGPHDRSHSHHVAEIERTYIDKLVRMGVVRRLK